MLARVHATYPSIAVRRFRMCYIVCWTIEMFSQHGRIFIPQYRGSFPFNLPFSASEQKNKVVTLAAPHYSTYPLFLPLLQIVSSYYYSYRHYSVSDPHTFTRTNFLQKPLQNQPADKTGQVEATWSARGANPERHKRLSACASDRRELSAGDSRGVEARPDC